MGFCMLEKMPFLHKGNAYNIIIDEDLTFDRLRFILDRLIEMGAFTPGSEGAVQFTVECSECSYNVGVEENNVLILLK